MISRRQFLGTTCCCLAYLASGKRLRAESDDLYHGCFLSSSEFRSVDINFGEIDTSTGNRTIDRAIGTTLTRISDLFDVHPGFGFYDDEDDPNAFATEITALGGTRGTVGFGYTLLEEQIEKHPSGISVMGIMGIIAHEFGHIVQFSPDVRSELQKVQPTLRLKELHADFLAGFYAGRRRLSHMNMDTDGLGDAFLALGNFNTRSPEHHGTGEERLEALIQGFQLGKQGESTINDAVEEGIQAVRRI